MTGDFIVATCSYDTEVDIDYTTNTINATIGSTGKNLGVMLYIVRQKQKMKESILLMFQIEVS